MLSLDSAVFNETLVLMTIAESELNEAQKASGIIPHAKLCENLL